MPEANQRTYDVALSFAGENREYVDQVASHLRQSGVKVFYDAYEEASLWGKDLYEHFADIYENKARYMVMFASQHYRDKAWPNHERRNAQARALREKQEYILPARFDDTAIPGVPETLGYVDLRGKTPQRLAALIYDKLVQGGVELRGPETPEPEVSIKMEKATEGTRVGLSVSDTLGNPITGAQVLLIAANGTYQQGGTDSLGRVTLPVPIRRLLTVFCAHEAYSACIKWGYDPVTDLSIKTSKLKKTGSIICPNGTGYVPGLEGRLNPIRDNLDRLYLYAGNIAIEGGKQQPVPYVLGETFEVEDRNGKEFGLKVIETIGVSSLIEFIER
jgi:hypothetical protein